jgi:hypothetical protein
MCVSICVVHLRRSLNALHVIPTLLEIGTDVMLIISSVANSSASHLEDWPYSNAIVTESMIILARSPLCLEELRP